jgi:hypothetical protein
VRFNAEGPYGLRDRKAPGPTPLLTDEHRKALAAQIDQGPIPASSCWTALSAAGRVARGMTR